MLGVVTNPCEGPVEEVMRGTAEDLGVGNTFRKTPVGVFFGTPGLRVDDPTSVARARRGPAARSVGTAWSGAVWARRTRSSRTTSRLAEGLGAAVEPLRTVVDVRPADHAAYRVTTEATGAWVRRAAHRHADQVVFAAGAWGTSGCCTR